MLHARPVTPMSDYVFFGNQDLGALGYDAWKTDVPEYYGYEDECDHEDYEITWEGIAHCAACQARWTATPEECAAYDAAQGRAAEAYAEMERRDRWRFLWDLLIWNLWYRWRPSPKV